MELVSESKSKFYYERGAFHLPLVCAVMSLPLRHHKKNNWARLAKYKAQASHCFSYQLEKAETLRLLQAWYLSPPWMQKQLVLSVGSADSIRPV